MSYLPSATFLSAASTLVGFAEPFNDDSDFFLSSRQVARLATSSGPDNRRDVTLYLASAQANAISFAPPD